MSSLYGDELVETHRESLDSKLDLRYGRERPRPRFSRHRAECHSFHFPEGEARAAVRAARRRHCNERAGGRASKTSVCTAASLRCRWGASYARSSFFQPTKGIGPTRAAYVTA
ncbi:hypothetical protein Bxe_B0907 [Paraburkholderia xenovorans LB400]|uniref:Uncharacterized protein n=1 Tax=Paraburkholderia xenovorans (strain LB400) TaxID=266265 RepID=Q13LJ2_PARXL|nr:hypothetical protein Bxe_B0907 [Paraburkholderia xenovorans LB400]